MLAYAAGGTLIAALFFMPVFPSFVLIDWIDARWLDLMGSRVWWPNAFLAYLLLALPASALLLFLTVLVSAMLRWALLPRLASGRDVYKRQRERRAHAALGRIAGAAGRGGAMGT